MNEPRQSRIPQFTTVEEEAEFWDTHDLADFWDEFKRVEVRVAKTPSDPLTIQLDPDSLTELRSAATQKGIAATALAEIWLIERLQRERKSAS